MVHDDQRRDDAIDSLLRQRGVGQTPRGGEGLECVDADLLAAWAEDTLAPADRRAIEAHVAGCERCLSTLAAFARIDPGPPPAASLAERWKLRWLVPLAAAATAVAVWVAIPPSERPGGSVVLERTVPTTTSPASPADVAAPPAAAPQTQERAERRDALADSAANATTAPVAEPLAKAESSQNAVESFERENAAPARPASPPPPAAAAPPAPEQARDAAAAREEAQTGRVAGAAPAALERRAATLQSTTAPVVVLSPIPAIRWRFTSNGLIERSTTGGTSWARADVVSPTTFTAGSAPDGVVCWLVGPAGAIRLTTDGLRFGVVPFPEAIDLVAVSATSARSARVTAADGRAFQTDDQGISWRPVAP